MKISLIGCSVIALVVTSLGSSAQAVTQQTAGHVFNDRPYLWVEAESYSSLIDTDDNGWKIVSKETPIVSVQGRDILPANSNVSGTALLDDLGGGSTQAALSDKAIYEVRFVTAGTYQLYTRHSMFDSDVGVGNFGNEDSIFISPGFNKNSSTDWNGFEGLEFNDAIVGSPNPIDGFDPDGFEPRTSDSRNNGWLAIRDWGVKSEGVVTFNNNANEDFWNGQFHWYNRPMFVSSNDATGGFVDDFGFKTEYIVTSEMVGQTVTFEIGTREHYAVIDGFLFIKDDLVDLLDVYSQAQVDAVLAPIAADNADFDGDNDVDGDDFLIWQRGLAESGGTLATGDANNDAAVNGADLSVWSSQFGTAATAAGSPVPEPASAAIIAFGVVAGFALRRGKGTRLAS